MQAQDEDMGILLFPNRLVSGGGLSCAVTSGCGKHLGLRVIGYIE